MYAEASGPPDAENPRFSASGGALGGRMYAETYVPPDAENPIVGDLDPSKVAEGRTIAT